MRRADIHQHFWPEALLSSLARRTVPPRLRDGWLELAGEPPSRVDPRDHDPGARASLAASDGLQRVIIAPSSPLGLESLPEAEALLDDFHAGVLELGPPFELWAGLVLADPAPERVDALLDQGAAGLCLPAGAVASREGLDALGPALERLGARGAPLFLHPGPAHCADAPSWWPAMTSYVAEMTAAWHAWAAWGPRDVRVVFAMLAGQLQPPVAQPWERRAARQGGEQRFRPEVLVDVGAPHGPLDYIH